MKLTEQELNRLRDIRIHGIIGIPDTGRRDSIRCPHGNSDRSPSCFIYLDNSWHCFSCNAHGSNAIDFVMSVEKVDFIRACEELIKYV